MISSRDASYSMDIRFRNYPLTTSIADGIIKFLFIFNILPTVKYARVIFRQI